MALASNPLGRDESENIASMGLYVACLLGLVDRIRFFIAMEDMSLLHYADHSGCTALHICARNGHDEAVGLLIEAGGTLLLRAKNQAGNTALHPRMGTRRLRDC